MTVSVKRTVKLVTKQNINPNKPPQQEGFPMRDWSVEIFILNNDTNSLVPATCFEKVRYKLHPSFGAKETQIKTSPPFRLSEEGWGEFVMSVTLYASGCKPNSFEVAHDLNFAEERYEGTAEVVFKDPKPELLALLRQSGPVGDANGAAGKVDTGKRKRATTKNVDMEKLAENLQKLDEEGLLHVVQMVHDNKSPETYAKNDVENGEFHVDLYTLSDPLVKMLWEYAESRGQMGMA